MGSMKSRDEAFFVTTLFFSHHFLSTEHKVLKKLEVAREQKRTQECSEVYRSEDMVEPSTFWSLERGTHKTPAPGIHLAHISCSADALSWSILF